MKRLLIGLDKLNGTEVANDTLTDYRKIQIGVANYLKDNDYFTDDEQFTFDLLRDKKILLLDDIITTGATASECARVLLTAGAKEIHCGAVAVARHQTNK